MRWQEKSLKIAAKTKEVKNCHGSNAILWSGQVSTFNQSYRFGRDGRLNIYSFSQEIVLTKTRKQVEAQVHFQGKFCFLN